VPDQSTETAGEPTACSSADRRNAPWRRNSACNPAIGTARGAQPSEAASAAAAPAEQFNVKPVESKAFLAGTLHADRTRELTEVMKAAGVPV
jgi:hypothetical protein